jgi:predicted O-methyltransferase YrrM
MPSLLDEILSTRRVHAADGSERTVHSNISAEEGAFLQRLVRAIRPAHSLEVGLAYGVSTLYICEALREVGSGQHTVIDPHQRGLPPEDRPHFPGFEGWEGIGLENIHRAGHADRVTWMNARSDQAMLQLVRDGRQFDFIFLDGWHTFDAVMVEFAYAHQLLRVGGALAFDDAHYPSVRAAIRFAVTNFQYDVWEPVTGPLPSLKLRVARRLLGDRLQPNLQRTDAELGLPPFGRYVALIKTNDIHRGDGTHGTQRWDAFHQF